MADNKKKYIGENALSYFWLKIKGFLNNKVDKVEGKGLSTNDLTDELKEKILNAGDSSFSGVYGDLVNKPSINGKTINGTMTLEDIGAVAAEEGKGLSTNDYTTTEKTKLAGVASGAQVNKIETVKVNGTAQNITDKAVDIAVPTKVSELTNDNGYLVATDISGKENSSNKVTTVTSTSTDVQYPSAKAVYTGLSGKVDKVSGKGLSTNDYTTAEKSKLAGIAENAQVNVIESIDVNGTSQTITDKNISITIPTKVSDLTNDKNYLTSYTETDPVFKAHAAYGITSTNISTWTNKQDKITFNSTYNASSNKAATMSDIPTNNSQLTNGAGYQTSSQVQTAINNALSGITGIDFQVVTTLPTTGVKGTIYLLSNSGETNNIYDEYIWLSDSSKWEKIGTTQVDLSNYLQTTDLVEFTNDEIDTIVV